MKQKRIIRPDRPYFEGSKLRVIFECKGPEWEQVRIPLINSVTQPDLDSAEKFLLENLKGFFIYKGGSHIAIHRKDKDPERLAIIQEK